MKENKNNLDKALQTNLGIMPPIDKKSQIDAFREPNFNQAIIQKRIDELNIEISDIQKGAFATRIVKQGIGFDGEPKLYKVVAPTSGVDIVDLQAKIAIRDSLIENLKTEKLR